MAEQKVQQLFQAALAARENSYAPYSKFRVGAAVALANGEIVGGCNVENASYGGTICAERNAIIGAVAKHGTKAKLEALLLITDPEATPCGLCLQVMAEFCGPDFPIHIATPKGVVKKVTLKQFLPQPFGPDKLK